MPGLSYREFLEFSGIVKLAPLTLKEIMSGHAEIALELTKQFKPLFHFREYLQYGYYPFFKENLKTYGIRLEQIVKMTIENDLRFIEGFDPVNTRRGGDVA